MGEGAKDGELKEVEGVLVVEKAEEIGEGVDRRMVRDCEGREGVFQSKFFRAKVEREFTGFSVYDSDWSGISESKAGSECSMQCVLSATANAVEVILQFLKEVRFVDEVNRATSSPKQRYLQFA